jgi:hypothetical protein
MVPHQIYQALTDQRSHELQAVARRHERVSDTRVAATDRVEGSSRLRGALGHLAALVHVRRSAYAANTTTGSAAAPMGCVA